MRVVQPKRENKIIYCGKKCRQGSNEPGPYEKWKAAKSRKDGKKGTKYDKHANDA